MEFYSLFLNMLEKLKVRIRRKVLGVIEVFRFGWRDRRNRGMG